MNPEPGDIVIQPDGTVDPLALDTLPQGTALTTVEEYSVEVKAKAYELFLHTDSSPIDIAIVLKVPRHVVLKWMRKGSWNDRKSELEFEAFRAAETQYMKFLVEHKLPTIERHLRVAQLIEEEIELLLKTTKKNGGTVDSMTLRRLSEALSSATGVSARATATYDRAAAKDREDEGGSKKQPLVIIGVSPQVPATIDVKEVTQ